MPELSAGEKERADMLAQEEFFKNGITSVHDAGSSEQVIDRWESLYALGKLKVRKYVMFRVEGRPDYDQLMNTASAYFKRGLVIGKYDNRLTVRAFKLSADGSMGARSAWMIEDYSDRPGHRGNGKLTDEQMYNVIKLSLTHGFQMVVHAIGDACNRQALDAYERVFRELPLKDHRCRIEHAQVLRPEDVIRFSQLSIIPSVQPIAFATDMAVVGSRWGAERMKTAYAWRKLRDSGCAVIPISTDAPVDDINPFRNMYAAVSRRNLKGEPAGGWYHSEAMTRAEALRGATIMGAYAAFEEQLKGSIEKGKLADFIIIDRDYMECPEEEIKDIKVKETVLGGETVYRQ